MLFLMLYLINNKMARNEFLKLGISSLGLMTVTPMIIACKSSSLEVEPATDSTNGSSSSDCVVNPSDTAGSFPKDIKAGEIGVNLTANI